MAVDPRQIVAAFLTVSMFAMLGNMIKNDHFSTQKEPEVQNVQFNVVKIEEASEVPTQDNKGPWAKSDLALKPCWEKPAPSEEDMSKGYVTFSLTSGPEYHVSQVAVAVLIARYLGATIVLPDIRGSELGQKRNFQDVYDVEKFMGSLDGVVNVIETLPDELQNLEPAIVRVPNRLTQDYVRKNILPVLQTKKVLRLAVHFPSTNMKIKAKDMNEMKSIGCLATFGTLELKSDVAEVVNTMVERLRTLSRKTEGRFIAVDLRVELLEKKGCKESEEAGKKTCFDARQVGEFLKKLGFSGDTTIYLTQTWWDESLNFLKEFFPKTYTKDDILPAEKKNEYLHSGDRELEKVIDFYVCSQSDVFVPAISGLFYGNVAGKRIASGRTQILVPKVVSGPPAFPTDFISSYVTKKNHIAYSCYC